MAFHGKVAVITGGGSGLGQSMARRLAAQGADVALLDLNEAGMQETASGYDNVHVFPCDVTDEARVNETISRIQQDLGPVDRLAHAAGILRTGRFTDMPADQIRQVMRVNYEGTVNITKAVLPQMLEHDSGDIIIYSSLAGSMPVSGTSAYCSSKAAVSMFTEILRHEHRDSAIRFLLVCPSAIDTPMMRAEDQPEDSVVRGIRGSLRMASPEKITDAIEKALEKGQWRLFPDEALAGWYLRRLSPSLLWKLTERFNKP